MMYGGWAYLANRSHGRPAGLRAGLVQGIFSFSVTLSMTLLIEALSQRFRDRAWGALLTIGCTSALVVSTALLLHRAAGTPEILRTVAPSFVVGAIYTTAYALGLRRLRPDRKERVQGQPPSPPKRLQER